MKFFSFVFLPLEDHKFELKCKRRYLLEEKGDGNFQGQDIIIRKDNSDSITHLYFLKS